MSCSDTSHIQHAAQLILRGSREKYCIQHHIEERHGQSADYEREADGPSRALHFSGKIGHGVPSRVGVEDKEQGDSGSGPTELTERSLMRQQ